MILSRLECTDFRNYAHLDVRFPPGIVVLTGMNGQGKSNLAEMIQFAATGKSHRTSLDRRLIRLDRPSLTVTTHFERRDLGPCSLAVRLDRDGMRELQLNGVPRRTQGEVLGYLTCALFSAGDVDLIAGEPGLRRRHLNEELAKAYPAYLDDLTTFRRALAQRNEILRRSRGQGRLPGHAHAFTVELASAGARVLHRRVGFVGELEGEVTETYSRIAATPERLCMRYVGSVKTPGNGSPEYLRDTLQEQLKAAEAEEIRRGITLVGPHRDDLVFELGGRDVRRYGSRGQQKTTAVALRLAEARRAALRDEPPILILDDIMSELDRGRREHVAAELGQFDQIFVIGTTESDFTPELLDRGARYRVQDGRVGPAV